MPYVFNPDHGPALRAAMTRISWTMRLTHCPQERERFAKASDRLLDCLGGRCCEDADHDRPCGCDHWQD